MYGHVSSQQIPMLGNDEKAKENGPELYYPAPIYCVLHIDNGDDHHIIITISMNM